MAGVHRSVLSLLFAPVIVYVHAQACDEGSQCTQGSALNITNATGACVHNPFFSWD
jgi:hypothetical protein